MNEKKGLLYPKKSLLTPWARAGAYAQAAAFSRCGRCTSGISTGDVSIRSRPGTNGISVLASTVELSTGNERRYWKQNCCYITASGDDTTAAESNVMISENNSGSWFSFRPHAVWCWTGVNNATLPFWQRWEQISVSQFSHSKGKHLRAVTGWVSKRKSNNNA